MCGRRVPNPPPSGRCGGTPPSPTPCFYFQYTPPQRELREMGVKPDSIRDHCMATLVSRTETLRSPASLGRKQMAGVPPSPHLLPFAPFSPPGRDNVVRSIPCTARLSPFYDRCPPRGGGGGGGIPGSLGRPANRPSPSTATGPSARGHTFFFRQTLHLFPPMAPRALSL